MSSILSQTYNNLDIIVYDDGSTDNTRSIIEQYKDPRVRIIGCDTNNGVVYARNVLLDACKTEYACWQDSDDVSNIYRVEILLKEIRNRRLPVLYSGWGTFRSNVDYKRVPQHCIRNTIAFATAMFQVNKVPRFEEIIRKPTPTTLGGEDIVWRSKLVEMYGNPFITRKELYYVRRHSDRISMWRKDKSKNAEWYDRMNNRVK